MLPVSQQRPARWPSRHDWLQLVVSISGRIGNRPQRATLGGVAQLVRVQALTQLVHHLGSLALSLNIQALDVLRSIRSSPTSILTP